MDEVVLEVRNLSKSFPGVKALDQVSFQVRKNEIVGLVGENGAGKSTLLKILIGAYSPDEGEIIIHGRSAHPRSVKEASDYGLAMVFQEQSLLSNLTVRENIFLGNEEPFIRFGVINWKKMDQAAREQLEKVELELDPGTYTDTLNFATRQMVELARVMTLEDRTSLHPIIILDEPTTVLDGNEVELLFDRLRHLRERASIIFVSHHLNEILEITDRVYIFKDGKNVAERKTSETSVGELHRLMVGRELKGEYYREGKQVTPGDEVVLSIQKLSKQGSYDDISLDPA
jgi:ribose transport system ATP-binding protein